MQAADKFELPKRMKVEREKRERERDINKFRNKGFKKRRDLPS